MKEFAEVQDLSTKLMAVMELKQTRTAFAPRSDGQGNSLSTKSVHDKRLLDVSPTQSAQSLESSTFSANGPIMRRPKPQRSSNSSSESHAQISLEMTLNKETRESKSKNKRYPLEDLQVVTQLSPSKRNPRKQGYVNEEGRHTFGLDENSNSFCSSDMFTNTSPDYLDGRHEKMTTTTDDDTTMEF